MVAVAQLQKFSIFKAFSDDELEVLSSHLTLKSVADRDFVFGEGERGDDLFFIASGCVQILKASAESDIYEEVRTVGEGDLLGEMAFLDNSFRSAAARAVGRLELIVLNKDAFKNTPRTAALEKKLVYQIALTIAHLVRGDTDAKILSYQKEREATQRQYEFGQFFVYILLCYATGMLINHALYTRFPILDIYNSLFAWSYLLLLMLPGIFLVWKLKIPWARVGVTFADWKVSVREGVIASLTMGTVFFGIVFICQLAGVLDFSSFKYDILTRPQYLLHSYGQEFLARGLLQNSLRRFFDDANGVKSVIISSFLFALLHIHFGLAAVFLTFVSSLVLGYFYLRHHSLLGVTILHWSMGVCAFVTGLL